MKKNLIKGISFTVGASLWWGIIGVIYFKFVSYASPLANQMIGKFEGDIIKVETPGGSTEYEIQKVEYI